MDRESTLALVKSWTVSPNLIKHMLSVEAAMRALANPDKKLASVIAESVIKKLSKKDFAKGVDRERFALIEPNLGLSTPDFVSLCLSSLQSISADLDL